MSYLDEARIDDEHVGRVPRDVLCSTLPLNRAPFEIGLATPIHIQPEFCILKKVVSAGDVGLPATYLLL